MSYKLILGLFLAVSTTLVNANEVEDRVKQLLPSIEAWGTNPVLVSAVKAQNAEGKSLDDIKAQDLAWRGASEITPLMHSLMKSKAAQQLNQFQNSTYFYFELFLMDNQGANVAMTTKTSDYWQGDEDKFIKSYANGKGDYHIGKLKFDESTQFNQIQLSVPVKDGDVVIGALTVGVIVDEL